MKTELINKAKELISQMETEALLQYINVCDDTIFDVVLDEVERRVPENKFTEICNALYNN